MRNPEILEIISNNLEFLPITLFESIAVRW